MPVIAAQCTGAQHIQAGTPCQDAYRIRTLAYQDKTAYVLAVADGHGNVQHDLSRCGARFAVKAAIAELTLLFQQAEPAYLKPLFAECMARDVLRHWRAQVVYHAQRWHGFNPEEVAGRQPLLKRYGTTLLSALVTADFVYLAQLGDGDILRIAPDGEVHPVFPTNNEQLGNVTFSLCSADAAKLWQTTAFKRQAGESLLLSSDGLSNAFSDERQFHAFARSLVQRVEEYGADKVAHALPGWLAAYSAQGSGDDISLILFSA